MRLDEIFDSQPLRMIVEGGNLELPSGERADTIDLSVHDRSRIVPVLKHLMASINSTFRAHTGKPLWSQKLLNSGKFLSGSSLHFLNTRIPDAEFSKVKPKVGDIDTQIDKRLASQLADWLDSVKGQAVGEARFLGYERGNEQLSSLWELREPPIKVQIDLEFVEYAKGSPTQWAAFSHSSAWEDIQAGVKGVFHKYLIQSFASLTHQDFMLRKWAGRGKARAEVDVPMTDNMVSFAVSSKEGGGLRQKYEPVVDDTGKQVYKDGLPVMRARPTEGYDQTLAGIFAKLFGKKISPKVFRKMADKFWSFKGLLDVMDVLLNDSEKKLVVDTFIDKLFAPGAQGLYKNDPDRDAGEKLVAVQSMLEGLGMVPPDDLQKMINDYKASYRMTESLVDSATPSYHRVGIKHIHNPGSSTEMKDAEFLDMLAEIHHRGGTLDGIPINLKVDGAGIRFGKDSAGQPFMMTSRVTDPLRESDIGKFTRHAESTGQTGPALIRSREYDRALGMILRSDFISTLPDDTIVQAEMLFNPMAQQVTEGLKFVNIPYDRSQLGEEMTLVPFGFMRYSTGKPLADADIVKQRLLAASTPRIKIISNQLLHEGVDLSKIITPVMQMESEIRSALSSRKREDPAKARAREVLTSARRALSEAILRSDRIKGKDQLGPVIEGLILNMPGGQMAKITSTEMRAAMSARAPAGINQRTRTAVVTAGSFAGHRGHQQLVDMVLETARAVGGDPYVYISSRVGPDDPLPPEVKLETWRRLYPEHASMFQLIVSPDGVTSPSPIKKIEKELVLPADSPYKRVILMVGEDRYDGFKRWMETLQKRMRDPAALAKFGGTQDQVVFETVKTSRSPEEGGTGISFTQLRAVLRDPSATAQQRLDLWASSFDGSKLGLPYVRHLMELARWGMGIPGAPSKEVAETVLTELVKLNTEKGIGWIDTRTGKVHYRESGTHEEHKDIAARLGIKMSGYTDYGPAYAQGLVRFVTDGYPEYFEVSGTGKDLKRTFPFWWPLARTSGVTSIDSHGEPELSQSFEMMDQVARAQLMRTFGPTNEAEVWDHPSKNRTGKPLTDKPLTDKHKATAKARAKTNKQTSASKED